MSLRLRRCDDAVVITAIEAELRGLLWRFLEYCAWVFLRTTAPARAGRLTVGLSQVRVQTIAGFLSCSENDLKIWQLLSLGERYRSACELSAFALCTTDRAGSVSRRYTGVHNRYYERLYRAGIAAISGTGES